MMADANSTMVNTDSGTLHVVGTPIGNLADFSERGKQTLAEVDLIACEDTRRTQKLLTHFDISTPTESYHGDSSDRKRERIIEKLVAGEDVALVSDAGTPAVSDPGMRLVQAAHQKDLDVVVVPGPSAITAALSVAGLKGHSFTFFGYVPRKSREAFVRKVDSHEHTSVFFESVHRIDQTLSAMKDILTADTQIVICRELTKQFESVICGNPAEVHKHLEKHPDEVKGEFTVIVSGKQN